MTNNKPKIKRRQFLKASTIAGVGPILTDVASAAAQKDQIRFVETGIRFRVAESENINYIQQDAICPPQSYDVLAGEQTLRVKSDNIGREQKKVLGDNATVIYSNKFGTGQMTISGSRRQSLVTDLSPRLQPEIGVSLTEEYKPPEAKVQVRDQIIISTNYSQEHLGLGEEITHQFQRDTVSVKMQKRSEGLADTNESIEEWRRAVATETWEEEIRIRPEIIIRNYGSLNVEFI